ncbi:MAG TPA: alpha/beta fold hydrolase [Stellaceae bacterium]|nr:alpha/beta fold hydrolase [Stellaceae bacterium]
MAETCRLKLWQDKVETEVEISGSGQPLLYLHGPWGLAPDRSFIERLAAANKVYAPRHPGTTRGDPNAAHAINTLWDLIVYYEELMDGLGLESVALAGHSFGGLVAAEIAANAPARVRRLVLIDPVGLWRDDHPVQNWMILPDASRPKALFADPAGDAAKRFFALPEDKDARTQAIVAFVWAQACTGKYIWPIPDKGLKHRIHRISAPTLVLWGKEDAIAAQDYAGEFAARIKGARVEFVDRAGHLPHLEQGERAAALVRSFLAG